MKEKSQEKTIKALHRKANYSGFMPSITRIHDLLDSLKIEHNFYKKTNVVEFRSTGNRYVNSRHNGKEGYVIKIDKLSEKESEILGFGYLELDTSDSYYSHNSWIYAKKLIDLIELRNEKK